MTKFCFNETKLFRLYFSNSKTNPTHSLEGVLIRIDNFKKPQPPTLSVIVFVLLTRKRFFHSFYSTHNQGRHLSAVRAARVPGRGVQTNSCRITIDIVSH